MRKMNDFGAFVFVVMSLLVFDAAAQTDEVDSLYQVIKTSENTEDRASAHGRIAWLIAYNDLNVALLHMDSSLVLFEKLENEKGIAKAHYRYGTLYRVSGNYEKALFHINMFMDYAKAEDDSKSIANAGFQRGVVFSLQGNYEQSLKEYYSILSFYESVNDSSSIGNTLNSIGIIYKNLKKYPEARENYEKAIAIQEISKDEENLANSYSNLGTLLSKQKKYGDAIDYFKEALAINTKNNNNWGISISKQSIGSVLLEKEMYEEAIQHLKEAYIIQSEKKYKVEMAITASQMGAAYLKLNDLYKSEKYLKEALVNIDDSKKESKEIHFNLSELYQEKGAYEKSLYHYKEHVSYRDSIFNEVSLKNIQNISTKYQTKKKDNEIALQKLELRENEVSLLKKRAQYYWSLAGALFFLLLSFAIWFFYMQRQKTKDKEILALEAKQEVVKLEALIDGEEKERNRLAQDLHDGINGDLAVIKYKVSSLDTAKFSIKEKTAHNDAIGMLDNAVEQVRRISHNLTPPSLQNFDLRDALQQLCTKQNMINMADITFQYFGDRLILKKENETAIYRIIQELLNNVTKHAKATEALVQINHHEDNLSITVEDNGVGFDTRIRSTGIGMQNIESRVSILQATLDINSTNKGTTFTIELDLNKIQA